MDVHDIMMITTMTSITDGHADHTCRGSSMHVNSHVSGLVCRSYHIVIIPFDVCGLWGPKCPTLTCIVGLTFSELVSLCLGSEEHGEGARRIGYLVQTIY